MRFILLLISILFVCGFTGAQTDHRFLEHLYKNNLEREIFHYLHKTEKNTDSLNYELMRFAVYFKNDSLLFSLIKKQNVSLLNNDSSLVKHVSVKLINAGNSKLNAYWYDSLMAQSGMSLKVLPVKEAWLIGQDPVKYSGEKLPELLLPFYTDYKKAYRKKPMIAASLSAMVPGLGKLYIHKPRAFVSGLFSVGLATAQSIESAKKLGVKHPFSIFNISVASLFYLSNVYGSYNDCRIFKKMKKTHYLNEANNYYTDYFNFSRH